VEGVRQSSNVSKHFIDTAQRVMNVIGKTPPSVSDMLRSFKLGNGGKASKVVAVNMPATER